MEEQFNNMFAHVQNLQAELQAQAARYEQQLGASATRHEQQIAAQLAQFEQQLAQIRNQPPPPVHVQVQSPPSVAAPTSTPLKPVKPSHFDGTSRDYDVDTWLSEMERYFKAAGIALTNERCVAFAASMLRTDASVWWENYHDVLLVALGDDGVAAMDDASVAAENREWKWDEFKAAIRAQFQPPNVSQNARDRLAKLHQTKSVLNYIAEFNKLCIRIDDIAEAEKLDRFVRGLKPNVRKEVKIKNPQTMIEAVKLAQTVDNIEWSERFANASSKQSYASPNKNRSYTNNRGVAPMQIDAMNMQSLTERQRKEKQRRERLCFECNKPGHFARNCSSTSNRTPKTNNEQKKFIQPQKKFGAAQSKNESGQ